MHRLGYALFVVKTVLLLDIDGVVVPMRHPNVVPGSDQVTFDVIVPPRAPANVLINPAVIGAINRWAVSGADIRWLTSWGWRTRFLDQVGLPTLPVLYDPDPGEVFMWGRSGLSWKRPVVADFLEQQSEPLRLAWADDDAFYPAYGDELRAAHPQLEDLLLVQPDCFTGITDQDICRIDGFLAR
jgi:hypothetical protein